MQFSTSKFFALILLLLISIVNVDSLYAQNKKILLHKAHKKIAKSEFNEGIALYKSIVAIDSSYHKAIIGLAETYYNLGQFDSSLVYYKHAIDNPVKNHNYFDYLGYANCLRLLNQPKKALKYYTYFEDNHTFFEKEHDKLLKADLSINKSYCNQCITKIDNIRKEIIVTNLGEIINTNESEYSAVFTDDDSTIIFNARHKDKRKENLFVDDEFFENIYSYNYKSTGQTACDKSDQQKTHFAIVGAIPNSDSILVYFENVLWISSYSKDGIKNRTPLPVELRGFYHQPSASFNKQQNKIIFSASKTIHDDLDIYSSNKLASGKWTKPIKITELCSKSNDDSPFLSDMDSTLYFSSKGFNSSGDYDIYKSTLNKDGKWSTPTSLDYPINSPSDDIFFEINNENIAFLSSNRTNGYGLMDIYKVQFPPKNNFICDTFLNTNLTVDLDILEDIDPNSVPLKYEWLFDDNEIFNGPEVTKTFKYPGNHLVKINIIDEQSGLIEQDEVLEIIIIDSVDFVGFKFPNYLIKDSLATFDASVSYIENTEIINYYWKINDSITEIDTTILNHSFNKEGNQHVTLQVNALNENNQYVSYCYTKDFNVITLKELADSTQTDSLNNSDFYPTDSLDYIVGIGNIIEDLTFKPVYFGFDKSSLTKKSQNRLDELILYLNKHQTVKIIISGHTDNMGSNKYNINLSKRRIRSVMKYLNQKGLDENRIYKTIGYGEAKPAKPNSLPNGQDNFNGRKLNRRVEFIIFE